MDELKKAAIGPRDTTRYHFEKSASNGMDALRINYHLSVY
jgi:hypothetical protein